MRSARSSTFNRTIDDLFVMDKANPWLATSEEFQSNETALDVRAAGGPGSGNFGHSGRPGQVGGSSGTPSTGSVKTALEDAKTGHTQFEKETGVPDKDWAGWYAEFVAKKIDVPAETLKPLIVEASKIHTGADWPEKYAEYITQHLESRSLGGPGSGNFGHAGRPGQVGGSSSLRGPGGEGSVYSRGEKPSWWVDEGGFAHTGITWKQATDPNTGRPIPIQVDNVHDAAELVLQGAVVEVPDERTAYTLINKLADRALEMKKKGNDAGDFDLCNVTISGGSMFCAEKLITPDHPKGIDRIEMPQLGGIPVPGSEADKLPRTPWNPKEVDGADAFVTFLQGAGMKTESQVVPANSLRASQRELKGVQVANIMNANFDPAANPIFISNDNYIVDGHHRWAAVVGKDLADGVLGDSTMNVRRINAPISEVLHIANAWSEKFGISQNAGVKKQAAETGLRKPS